VFFDAIVDFLDKTVVDEQIDRTGDNDDCMRAARRMN